MVTKSRLNGFHFVVSSGLCFFFLGCWMKLIKITGMAWTRGFHVLPLLLFVHLGWTWAPYRTTGIGVHSPLAQDSTVEDSFRFGMLSYLLIDVWLSTRDPSSFVLVWCPLVLLFFLGWLLMGFQRGPIPGFFYLLFPFHPLGLSTRLLLPWRW